MKSYRDKKKNEERKKKEDSIVGTLKLLIFFCVCVKLVTIKNVKRFLKIKEL